ncbi:MAG: hypothetical protein RR743_02965 [Oscillospiraceae bacterium]
MEKTTMKKILGSALALTVICSCTAAPFAMGYKPNPYETAAKDYANQIEALVEETGAEYEQNAKDYETNPVSSQDYNAAAAELGGKFLSGIGSSTGSYIGSLFGR